jgi:insulysin
MMAGGDLSNPAIDSRHEAPLYGALDRFAQMFIDPRFLPSIVYRELQAVDSEFRDNVSDDGNRVWQVEKSISNPNHPWSHFEDGNLDSLKTTPEARGLNVRDTLLDFFRRHYSANRMKLAVLAREPLAVLKEWVLEIFAGIVNLDLPENCWVVEGPLRPEDLGTQCFVKLIMDHKFVDLKFRFLDETSMPGCRPSQYLSHLLQHRAAGSILSYLKSRLVSGIETAVYPTGSGSPWIFLWRIYLTTEGLREYQEVVKVFFHYIALLRSTPPQEWIFNELVKQADYDFKFKEKLSASTFTTQTSERMQSSLPRQWLLSGNM